MKYSICFMLLCALVLSACAKRIEDNSTEYQDEVSVDVEGDINDEDTVEDIQSTYEDEDETQDEEDSSYLGSDSIHDRPNCTGTDTDYTCVDPNNGNTYDITKYGNITEVQGSSTSGSTWSQTIETVGDTVYMTGYDKDGNQWTQTRENTSDGFTYWGEDSDGNSFSGSCDSYSGCEKDY